MGNGHTFLFCELITESLLSCFRRHWGQNINWWTQVAQGRPCASDLGSMDCVFNPSQKQYLGMWGWVFITGVVVLSWQWRLQPLCAVHFQCSKDFPEAWRERRAGGSGLLSGRSSLFIGQLSLYSSLSQSGILAFSSAMSPTKVHGWKEQPPPSCLLTSTCLL